MKWLMLAAVSVAAWGAESATVRGKRVVDEAIVALGGEKFLSMSDRTESGRAYSFYNDRLTGLTIATIYTRYRTSPDAKISLAERESFGKKQDYSILFADDKGWELTFRGARPLPEDRVTRFLESTERNIFYILRMRLKERGLQFESQGASVVDQMPVEIVDLIDAENRVTTVYFHQSTKLPVRQVVVRRNPVTKEKDEEITLFSKYRSVDGIQWPYAIQRFRNGDKLLELYSENVTMNKALTDDLFTIPANMPRLKEAR